MDTTPQTPVQPSEEMTPNFADHKKGGLGPVLGIIVIIILLALGGLYYFTTGINQIQDGAMMENDMTADEEAAALRDQDASTQLSDIEADVNATNLSGLDESSADFESELNAQ